MELSINTQSLEPDSVISFNNYSGILNTNYKSIVISNYRNFKSKSLFNRRQQLKSWSYNRTCCATATLIKVALFAVMLVLIAT
ncbi:hypothetical protein [Olleya namhaensis]|uniref:Uncharacterized protein n=1 Tax=Olleya namhaensis TaxID=1144750 RepID=A0A1I3L8K2_9FLAO|nr:hypothetical protein [Olleya namhaensis]SFI80836.1 hypothetical protein SAMN05443431_102277 [Olleya namhaensis]